MNDTTEQVLIEALDLLEQGLSLDEIVARYPADADLRSYLMTAVELTDLAHQPTLTAQAQSKRTFLAAADRSGARPARVAGSWVRRLAMSALAVLVVLVLAGVGLGRASGSAVPGDALYETKRLVEQARLDLATNPELAADLREQYRRERVHEIEQLLADGRASEVSLTGQIETIEGERWTVAGIPVVVAPATVIDGRPAVGALVQVDGLTDGNAIIAARVMVLTAVTMPPPRATDPPRPTVTPATDAKDPDDAVTPTAMPTPTIRPSPTSQPTLAPTTTAAPTLSAPTLPAPTATPDDDDNGDDLGNDHNGEDQGNDDNGSDNGDHDDGSGNDNADDSSEEGHISNHAGG